MVLRGREDLTLPMASSEKVKQEPSTNKTQLDVAWERIKKTQRLLHKDVSVNLNCEQTKLTDEDLDELKGSIELGFGFSEKAAGQKLCNTLPALDLYFAVSSKKTDSDALKILCPGGNPQQVKQRLRHWAQAVACSVKQSS